MTADRRSDDERLVAAFRAGDDAAFDVIDARYRPLLVRYARRLLGRHSDVVDDVVQEALLRASRALRRDERQMLLKPWLYRLVRNCCLDELSRVRTDSVDLATADSAGLLVADDAGLIERRLRVHELFVDLAALPDLQRHALVRRELDGLSHEQLATELDLSVSATRSLVFRARANLAKLGLARAEPCADVQRALLAAHDARRRASAHVYRHVAGCRDCRGLRRRLVATRRGLAALSPAPLLLAVAALAGKQATGGTVSAKLAVGGTAGAVLVGGLGLGTHVFGPGDASPVAIRSAALPGGAVATGAPLPPRTAVVLRTVELAAGTEHHPRLQIVCPAGLTIADLLPPDGTRLSVTYDPASVVGSSRRATLVFERKALARRAAVTVGTLCKATDRRGSIVTGAPAGAARAGGASAATVAPSRSRPTGHWAHVRVRHAYLHARPGGTPRGSVRQRQPVWVLRRAHGWREVVADTGERGWITNAQLGA